MSALKNPNGLVLWAGSSNLDQQPIVAIMTGLAQWTANRKTGPMHQVWILRADLHPQEALNSGADYSICGNCPMRKAPTGKRMCYVNPVTLGQVYKQYVAGRYGAPIDLTQLNQLPLGVRLGAYGDPCAVPLAIWQQVLTKARYHTGYTRQWARPEYQAYSAMLMASCFNPTEQAQAAALGWKTYRVKSAQEPKLVQELACPAAREQINPSSCQQCRLCKGSSTPRHIVVDIHGLNKHLFQGDLLSA